MKRPILKSFLLIAGLLSGLMVHSQLVIVENSSAQALAQKLVGDGVTISNATLTRIFGPIVPTAFFNNLGGTNIGIDSGIVLTNGRAKSDFRNLNTWGLDGNGTRTAVNALADNALGLPGDITLANELGLAVGQFHDAMALEFDFVPLGDSIRFNYVLSSEEYDENTVCVFNDAFGFFISGPGIAGNKNIALIPGTSTPVTIKNINDVLNSPCPSYEQYYVDNTTNTNFIHNGHTTVLIARSAVQPCQTYHLKLVIADMGDDAWDSGVFLQAKSLTSNIITIGNQTQIDPSNNSYIVEGCVTGSFEIRRPRKDPTPLPVTLSYTGTAINGVDVQLLPVSVVIPANDSLVVVNVIPIIDNIPEGIETIKVYALAGCAAGIPTDSTVIQIRDYDILSLTPDTAFVCRDGSLQLTASPGYTDYKWEADPTLSSTIIRDPVATPVNSATTYICTATIGTCNARDSVFLKMKTIELTSKQDVNCKNGATGNIHVTTGNEWATPVQYSLDGINWQANGDFLNLPVGNYRVKTKDAICTDSIPVTIVQAFPDLLVNNIAIIAANCSGDPDGQLTVTTTGGEPTYTFSTDGINFQTGNIFNVLKGNYTITLKDNNGCLATKDVTVPLNDTLTLDPSSETIICEGDKYVIPATSNAQNFTWTSTGAMSGANTLTPTANPVTATWYYILATTGICSRKDSVKINVRPAPVANAGDDIQICFGKTFQLNGSGGTTYQWNPATNFTTASNIPAPSAKAKEDITYYLSVTDANGCPSLISDPVLIDVTPSVKIFAGKDTVAAINQPLQLLVIETGNSGVTNYTWSPGTFLSDAGSAKPIATLPYDQRYVVTGITADGCEGVDDIIIKVYKGPDIYVPSGFSPNNDGLNDLLSAIPVGLKEFRYFNVFNRWGQLIFSTKDPSKGWDGKINGAEQPTGTFIWIAEGIDHTGKAILRKGTATIIR